MGYSHRKSLCRCKLRKSWMRQDEPDGLWWLEDGNGDRAYSHSEFRNCPFCGYALPEKESKK